MSSKFVYCGHFYALGADEFEFSLLRGEQNYITRTKVVAAAQSYWMALAEVLPRDFISAWGFRPAFAALKPVLHCVQSSWFLIKPSGLDRRVAKLCVDYFKEPYLRRALDESFSLIAKFKIIAV